MLMGQFGQPRANDWPELGLYLPIAQSVQLVAPPNVLVYLPGTQLIHEPPDTLAVPGLQLVHAAEDVEPVCVFCVPAGQLVQLAAPPVGLYVLMGQASHD